MNKQLTQFGQMYYDTLPFDVLHSLIMLAAGPQEVIDYCNAVGELRYGGSSL